MMRNYVNISSIGGRAHLAAMLLAAGVMSCLVAAADSASGTSAIVRLDSRETRQAMSPCDVQYSPAWAAATNVPGAYVVLKKTELVGRSAESTSTLATGAADASGAYSLSVAEGGERCVRLTHEVRAADGSVLHTMTSDVSLGYQSAAGASFVADSRTNSLQLAASSHAPVNLSYSTAWATNAAAVSISAVRLSGEGGAATATNAMFSVAADAEGTTPLRGVGKGWWRLLCRVADGSDGTLLEYLTDEFKMPGGLLLSVW